jgi:hypothetical protein
MLISQPWLNILFNLLGFNFPAFGDGSMYFFIKEGRYKEGV